MKAVDFHPSQLPVTRSFQIADERKAPDVAEQMVRLGFVSQKGAFRVIMTKDQKVAKKIGFTIMNELNFGLRKTKQERDVRYWIYSYDADHYAMVLISSEVMQKLGF
jgi:GTP-binding protein EngB required for normal cell division